MPAPSFLGSVIPDTGIPTVQGTGVGPTAPPMAAPSMPSPMAPHGMPPRAPSFLGILAPIAASLLAGRGNPEAVGRGLAAFQHGRRLKQAEREHQLDRQAREQRESAEFHARAIEQSQAFDDPIQFEQWRTAITPLAKVYGVDPATFAFNNEKARKKDVATVQDAVDRAVKLHGPEILNRDDVQIALTDGRRIGMKEARALLAGTVTANGAPVTVPDTTKQPTPRQAPMPGSFEDFYAETDPVKRQKLLEDRKVFNQIDDRPRINVTVGGRNPREVATFNGIVSAYERSPLVKAADRTIVLDNAVKAIEANPSDPANQLQLAYSYIQALDTYQSAVREGELQNLGVLGTRLQSFVTQLNRVAFEGAFMPPEVAKNIAANAKQLVATIRDGQVRKQQQFASQAKVSGVGDMWSEFVAGSTPSAPVAAAPQAPGGPATTTTAPWTYDDYKRQRGAK